MDFKSKVKYNFYYVKGKLEKLPFIFHIILFSVSANFGLKLLNGSYLSILCGISLLYVIISFYYNLYFKD